MAQIGRCGRRLVGLLLALALAGCGVGALPAPTPDAEATKVALFAEFAATMTAAAPAPTATATNTVTPTPTATPTLTPTPLPEPTASPTPATPAARADFVPALEGCVYVPESWQLSETSAADGIAMYEASTGLVVMAQNQLPVPNRAAADEAASGLVSGIAGVLAESGIETELSTADGIEVELGSGIAYEYTCAFRLGSIAMPGLVLVAPLSESSTFAVVALDLNGDELTTTFREDVRSVVGSYSAGEACEAPPDSKEPTVEVTDWTWYLDGVGYLHIEGEVANRTDTPVQFVELQFKLLDASKDFLGTASGYTNSLSLGVGQTSIFEVVTRAPKGVEWVVLTNVNWMRGN